MKRSVGLGLAFGLLGIGEMALANDIKLRGLNHSDRIPNQYIVVLKEDVVSTRIAENFNCSNSQTM